MKSLQKFIGIWFTVLATGMADAVSLSDCTKDGNTITIPGADESFPKYEGWIPWLKPYSNGYDWGTDQKTVIWTNKKLSDVKAMRCKMSGAWFGGAERDGRALITKRTDSTMEVQFQCQDGSACKTVLAHLEQAGDDIVIWGQQAGYSETVKIGSPISSFWLQVSSTPNNGAYGVYGIEVLNVLETTPTELKEYAATVGDSGTDTLQVNEGSLVVKPIQPNDVFDLNITGNANVYFEKGDDGEFELEALTDGILTTDARTVLFGYSLNEVNLISVKSGGSWMGVHDADIYYLQQSQDKWTFQVQNLASGYTRSVLVELTDGAKGIQARVVWGRYKETHIYQGDNYCPLGTDFSAIDGYYTYVTNPSDMRATLSSLILKVASPSINFASSKSSWTTWGTTIDGGTVRVTNKPLAANPLTFVENDGILRLEVAAGDYNGGDSRHYEVGKNSSLVLTEGMCITHGGSVTLDGGHLDILNGFLYVNNVTIRNGGSVSGSSPRLGWSLEGQWLIEGSDPVTIGTGFTLFNNNAGNRAITFDVNAATTISGSLRDDIANATFVKKGSNTLTLGAENYNNGAYRVEAGKLIFANPKGIKSNNAVILGGGGYVGPFS